MKIRKLQLKNIGVFDDETIEFQKCPEGKAEIHIFTGENGTGKTTILQTLASSFDFSRFDEQNAMFGSKENYEKFLIVDKLYGVELSNVFEKRFRKNEVAHVSVNFEGRKNPFSFTWADGVLFDLNLPLEISQYSTQTEKEISNYHEFNFAVFTFSGYRHIQSERIEAIKEPQDFNPLNQSLEFIKDYNQDNQISINQLIANNISKSAIEKGRNEKKSTKFANVIKSVEQVISDITGWKVEFDLETEPTKLITKVNGEELDFDVLPDGLRSLISWIADLLGRIDLLKWKDDLPILEKNLILFLDEIEVHLHPAWQRKVLPVVQNLFKNSQIFVSTHSPFVVNSIDDAWIYKLKLNKNGKAKVESIDVSEDGHSYSYVLEETFDIKEEFGIGVEKELDEFYKLRDSILSNGSSNKNIKKIERIGKDIAKQSEELNTIIQIELRQINRKKGLNLEI